LDKREAQGERREDRQHSYKGGGAPVVGDRLQEEELPSRGDQETGKKAKEEEHEGAIRKNGEAGALGE